MVAVLSAARQTQYTKAEIAGSLTGYAEIQWRLQ
jgi:hypothetical protein